ncbi:MAG: lipoyl synthase [Ardenticatenales bacterium]|nr:lipoyl synthase [Ardenticatenales bacterium]
MSTFHDPIVDLDLAALTADDGRPLPFRHRRPPWLKVRAPWGETFGAVEQLMRSNALHTVCEEARCPNIGECWGAGTATFLIMGDTCTRSCGFCAIKTGRPGVLDVLEPERVARTIERLNLTHCVITSVNRDELPDGGAAIFGRSIARSRALAPHTSIEVLIPDFCGDRAALQVVMDARPEILNHNLETVPRLYRTVRPQAIYPRSLDVLRWAKEMDPTVLTKTGIMVGLGETWAEIETLIGDLVAVGVDILTVGQYLRPTEAHLPIMRYWSPDEFDRLRDTGLAIGLRWVEAGPLVRSSYRAEQQVAHLSARSPHDGMRRTAAELRHLARVAADDDHGHPSHPSPAAATAEITLFDAAGA